MKNWLLAVVLSFSTCVYAAQNEYPVRTSMDWMCGAYDVRGDVEDGKYLRLRNGKVDIGCYQCWLDPVGSLLLLR